MSESDLLEHLIDIKERLASIEAKQDEHLLQHAALKEKVQAHEEEIIAARTSLKTLRWVAAVLFISLPAAAAAIVKVIGKG